jgi:hypothetical protein
MVAKLIQSKLHLLNNLLFSKTIIAKKAARISSELIVRKLYTKVSRWKSNNFLLIIIKAYLMFLSFDHVGWYWFSNKFCILSLLLKLTPIILFKVKIILFKYYDTASFLNFIIFSIDIFMLYSYSSLEYKYICCNYILWLCLYVILIFHKYNLNINKMNQKLGS